MLDETVSHFSTNELMMCEVVELGGYYFDDEQSLIYEPLPILIAYYYFHTTHPPTHP